MGRASKDKRDIYYRKAKEEGFRARSAYKLLQIHEEFNILDPAQITTGAVDLCAAPGSWSQVLSSHFESIYAKGGASNEQDPSMPSQPKIVAVDLQEMAPINGVTLLQGDITSEVTAREIIRLLNDNEKRDSEQASAAPRKADIVVCDGAPDVTGIHELDEYLQHHLLLAALNITTFVLREGGCFVTKMFRGPNTPFLVAKSELFFDQVRVVKPMSSRNASMESFLLCQNFHLPASYCPHFILSASNPAAITGAEMGLTCHSYTPDAPRVAYEGSCETEKVSTTANASSNATHVILPFLSCGSLEGFDADMCYHREEGVPVLKPIHPPIQAPYIPAVACGGVVEMELKKARIE